MSIDMLLITKQLKKTKKTICNQNSQLMVNHVCDRDWYSVQQHITHTKTNTILIPQNWTHKSCFNREMSWSWRRFSCKNAFACSSFLNSIWSLSLSYIIVNRICFGQTKHDIKTLPWRYFKKNSDVKDWAIN